MTQRFAENLRWCREYDTGAVCTNMFFFFCMHASSIGRFKRNAALQIIIDYLFKLNAPARDLQV